VKLVELGGVNTTLYVQDAPAVNVAPQVPGPPACRMLARAKGCGVPPPNVKVPPVSVVVPVFVTVNVRELLVTPVALLPKASVLGDTVAFGGAMPVPVSVTGEPVTAGLALIVNWRL
jgi:hypothetical protein